VKRRIDAGLAQGTIDISVKHCRSVDDLRDSAVA
jgi:hypothetical protein